MRRLGVLITLGLLAACSTSTNVLRGPDGDGDGDGDGDTDGDGDGDTDGDDDS